MEKKHSILKSFSYAWSGLKLAFKKEPNFKVHASFTLATTLLALILKFNLTEWMILFITISFVLMMELINTVMESMVDLVSPEIKNEAKIAKDVSAAAVLVSTTMAVLIGIFLYLPKIL